MKPLTVELVRQKIELRNKSLEMFHPKEERKKKIKKEDKEEEEEEEEGREGKKSQTEKCSRFVGYYHPTRHMCLRSS